MGLINKSRKTTSTTDVNDTSASIGGDANAPVITLGKSDGNTVNVLDGGAIEKAFSFADAASSRSTDFADQALDRSTTFAQKAIESGSEQAREAQQRALAFVSQNVKTDAEKQRETFLYLAGGLMVLVGVVILWAKK